MQLLSASLVADGPILPPSAAAAASISAAATSPAAGRPPFFNISSTLQSPAATMGPGSLPTDSRGYYEDESSDEDDDYKKPAFASASPARCSPTAVGNNRGLAFSSPLGSRPSAAAGTTVYTIRPASLSAVNNSSMRGSAGGAGGRYLSPSSSRSTDAPSLGFTGGGARIGAGGSGRHSSPSSPRGSVSFSATAPAAPGSASHITSMSAAARPGSASRVSRLREQFPLFSSPQQHSSRCGGDGGKGYGGLGPQPASYCRGRGGRSPPCSPAWLTE